METERDRTKDSQHDADEVEEAPGALNRDNAEPSEDAGEKGAGTATGARGGLEHGSEPRDRDAREHERP